MDASEGVETLRNLLGAMVLNKRHSGIIVSTADHFTYRARIGQNRARSVGYEISLVDRSLLGRMLDPMLPDRPWIDYLSEHYPELAKYFSERVPSSRQLSLFGASSDSELWGMPKRLVITNASLENMGFISCSGDVHSSPSTYR